MPDAPKAARKPTKAQRAVLEKMAAGADLRVFVSIGLANRITVGVGNTGRTHVRQLVLDNLILAKWVARDRTERAGIMAMRTYYALTPLGRAALSALETD